MFGCVKGRKSGVVGDRDREVVALLVSEKVNKWVVEWKEVSSRIMWVKMKVGCEVWVFESSYGPGKEIKEEKREEFWVDLNECLESFGVNVNIILLGDLNARVGDEHVVGITGKYGVPDRNWNGEKVLEMCMERELTIMNTMFKKKRIHKYKFVWMAHLEW